VNPVPDLHLRSLLDPRSVFGHAGKLAERFGDEAYYAVVCIRAGMIGPQSPQRAARLVLAFERHGLLGGAVAAGAIRHGDQLAVIDERGELTYGQLDERTNRLANAWRERGLTAGEGVTILARNHRHFLEAVFAAAKCGAKIVLLNTDFAGPQIRDVAGREGTDLLVFDDEFADTVAGLEPQRGRWRAWTETSADGQDTLEWLIQHSSDEAPAKAGMAPRITILTSGTTGAPKGAPRAEPRSLALIGGLLTRVPFRARETTELCVPMFHALGFSQAVFGIALGSTIVVRRRFRPEDVLASVAERQASAMVAVPVMLRRMVDLPEAQREQFDTSSLKIILISGSALGPDLATRAIAAFGPILYNLYGSTEVAYGTIAAPEDLTAEPGTAGRVVHGTVVKILGDGGREIAAGHTGRIFVGNRSQFEGYTGGGELEAVGGLIATGDVGHFDAAGRLFIDGRDDEMIVSGGENVFPAEVEELLSAHPAIEEAAVIGVEDEQFGQRLQAFVVLRPGAELTEDQIKDYVRGNLARYKTPRDVVFVDELPRNPSGKVLKRELRQLEAGAAGQPLPEA
jgi:fatty-acyl-CoA synthase